MLAPPMRRAAAAPSCVMQMNAMSVADCPSGRQTKPSRIVRIPIGSNAMTRTKPRYCALTRLDVTLGPVNSTGMIKFDRASFSSMLTCDYGSHGMDRLEHGEQSVL